MQSIIEVENLGKCFVSERPLYRQILNPFGAGEKIFALKEISFSVKSGEILGVVGPNGAGKTTLLRILADLLMPDKGKLIIYGREVKQSNWYLRNRLGYVSSDERSFFWRLTGRENLEFFGRLYGLSGKEARRCTQRILKEFAFNGKSDRLFRDYSAGMRKKIAVMRALLHRPPIVLLDEVTNSLDSASAKMVKTLVREYVSRRKNRAALWSTHRLEEIVEICDRVIVIEDGVIQFHGRVSSLHNKEPQVTDYLLKKDCRDSVVPAGRIEKKKCVGFNL